MILIDINVKIEEIEVEPDLEACTFELKDADNLDTKLRLHFYKKQTDFIIKKFYDADRELMRQEIDAGYLKREITWRKQASAEYLEKIGKLEQELRAEITAELGGKDA